MKPSELIRQRGWSRTGKGGSPSMLHSLLGLGVKEFGVVAYLLGGSVVKWEWKNGRTKREVIAALEEFGL